MISYAPLMSTLHKLKMTKSDLQESIGVSSATIAKLSKDEPVSLKVIDYICEKLNCKIEDVIVHIKEQNHQQ
ncbi:helix-turn-helix domain-containing protein [Cytobacillus purgationiresistens]|uniref:DNA-binding Xre family transcriptional regulator n=1 Tax=Cytobacillus purgationiresistens TaxID=863449 RepID=A0ABU0AC94_9BACI|nr:helix-turn-helix transcriptional regulator [Cytobacillus purgationiresistens]MDQ0268665.1 DNA-binding Xre family transcriptional regulator [Cytobacillus purgationiresistens]